MRSNSKYFKWLEKKSKLPLTVNQLKDSAIHIHQSKFPEVKKEKLAIVFCHKDIKGKVVKNRYVRNVRKNVYHDNMYMIYSHIINKYYHNNKDKTGYYMVVYDNGNYTLEWNHMKKYRNYGVKKIISGGQTGADQGGLIAGKFMKIYTGGTAPNKYLTECGSNFDLRRIFGLCESEFSSYQPRTLNNIIDSDGTVLFGNDKSPGSKLTIKYCKEIKKPLYKIKNPSDIENNKIDFIKWIMKENIQVLNVAGNRESVNKGITKKVFLFLMNTICTSNLQHGKANKEFDLILDFMEFWNTRK